MPETAAVGPAAKNVLIITLLKKKSKEITHIFQCDRYRKCCAPGFPATRQDPKIGIGGRLGILIGRIDPRRADTDLDRLRAGEG